MTERISCQCLASDPRFFLLGGTAFSREGFIKGAIYFMDLEDCSTTSLIYLDESSSETPNKVHCIEEIRQNSNLNFSFGTDKFVFMAAVQRSTSGRGSPKILQLLQVFPVTGVAGIHKIFSGQDSLKCLDMILGKIVALSWKEKWTQECKLWWEREPPTRGYLKNAFINELAKLDLSQNCRSGLKTTYSDVLHSDRLCDKLDAKPVEYSLTKAYIEKDRREGSPDNRHHFSAKSDGSYDYTISVPDTCTNNLLGTVVSSHIQLDSCVNFTTTEMSKGDSNLPIKRLEQLIAISVQESKHESRQFEQNLRPPIVQVSYKQTFNLPVTCKKLGFFAPLGRLVVNDSFSLDIEGKALSGAPVSITNDSIVFRISQEKSLSVGHSAGSLWRHSNSHGVQYRYQAGKQLVIVTVAEDIVIFDCGAQKFAQVPSLLQNISFSEHFIACSLDCSTVASLSKSDEGSIELRYWNRDSNTILRSNLSKICKICVTSL